MSQEQLNLETTMTAHSDWSCSQCGEDDATLMSSNGGRWCKPCNHDNANEAAVVRRAIEVGEGLTRAQVSALPREEQKRLRIEYRDTSAANTVTKVNPYADLDDTLPEQERREGITDDEYNKYPARLYLLQTDPTFFPTTLNGGVTTKKPRTRLAGYRRSLDSEHPCYDTLDFWIVATIPHSGRIIETKIHAMMSEYGKRVGKREEWKITEDLHQQVIEGFYRTIQEWGGSIHTDNTKV